ncbi:MAG TPA: N-acetylmuramoyl-L-alanine amidase [Actinophytocola sp.]|uniref:N-acetylmuramoyl-L-alanine amidase n=1 Tax=Actinophytocola sp. TaxID=1872138 RepID=UPI002DBC6C44|nr:N-acetylmuramoyl-L-alanine amidase [Actinophytocola sp.]HEU5475705.1 N-acetylmuramoyl-L-alanine amidase [Actinophytocola sp.]
MAPSSPRGGARVIWIAVHTAEGIRKASDLKAFFDRSTNSSAHACADDSVLIDNCVPYDRAAWTLRGGNTRSDNLELCGFAAWSREEWLTNHQGMLRHAANWIRARCLARGIPIRKLDAAGVSRGEAGVIGHVDYTNGTRDGTHWDPGPGFPWDVVISMAAGQEDDVSWNDILTAPSGYPAPAWAWLVMGNVKAENAWAAAQRIEVQLAALAGTLTDDEAKIVAAVRAAGADPAAVAAHLAPLLAVHLDETLGRLSDEDVQRIADRAADERDRRDHIRSGQRVDRPAEA